MLFHQSSWGQIQVWFEREFCCHLPVHQNWDAWLHEWTHNRDGGNLQVQKLIIEDAKWRVDMLIKHYQLNKNEQNS